MNSSGESHILQFGFSGNLFVFVIVRSQNQAGVEGGKCWSSQETTPFSLWRRNSMFTYLLGNCENQQRKNKSWTCICSKVCLRTSFPAPTSLSAKKLRTCSISNWVEKWLATEAMMWPMVKLPEWNWSKICCQWRCRCRQAGSWPERMKAAVT